MDDAEKLAIVNLAGFWDFKAYASCGEAKCLEAALLHMSGCTLKLYAVGDRTGYLCACERPALWFMRETERMIAHV